jgi:hypothetical protein
MVQSVLKAVVSSPRFETESGVILELNFTVLRRWQRSDGTHHMPCCFHFILLSLEITVGYMDAASLSHGAEEVSVSESRQLPFEEPSLKLRHNFVVADDVISVAPCIRH